MSWKPTLLLLVYHITGKAPKQLAKNYKSLFFLSQHPGSLDFSRVCRYND